MPKKLIQRIIDSLNDYPKSILELNVGVSGVYLRSAVNAMVELGMIHEHQTWPRKYSLRSHLPDEFLPDESSREEFDLMFEVPLSDLDRERVTQHIAAVMRTAQPDSLHALRGFMALASAKITDQLNELEPVTLNDINVIPLKRRK